MGSRLAYTNENSLPVFDLKSGAETVQVTAESLNLILNVKDAAGSTVVVNTVKKPIASMEGAMIGSYWGKKDNIVWEGGVDSKNNTSHLLSVTTTGGAAACVIDDATFDLEQLFESAITCRYVIKVWDTQNRYRYGWVQGITGSGTQYTLTIYNNVTTASGTQDWVGSATIGTVSKFKIYKYNSSIVWGSTDTFTEEVEYEDSQNDADVLKNLTNGQYAVDYKHGRILGRKANGDNTETISYYYLATPLGSASITVDSEFPAAAAITDNFANPTTTNVMAMGMVYDGATWDRMLGNSTDGVLVNLGANNDVTVTSQVPGTGATNLGKAIDSVVGATDTGVGILAKRVDGLAGLTPANGDYTPLQVDNQGQLWVTMGGPINVTTVSTVTSLSQFAGQAINLGSGATGTGTLRTVSASDDAGVVSLGLLDDTVFTDDAAFTPATSKGLMMMAQADETGPDSVDEGDAGALRMTLTRFLKVSLGDLISGEDQTNNVLSTVEKPVSVSTYTPDMDTSAAAEASSVTKASTGNLYGFTATNSSGASRYLQFFNSTTVPADTTVPVLSYFCAAGGSISDTFVKGRNFTTGIAWAWSSTAATKTVGSTDGIADIRYK